MNERMQKLTDAGVSVWLDDLSRTRIASGSLAAMISDYGVSGVTTNPSIFAAALAGGSGYEEGIGALRAEGVSESPRPSRGSPPPTSATPAACSVACSRPPVAWMAGCRSRSSPGSPWTPRAR